jgi:hypothetical protein
MRRQEPDMKITKQERAYRREQRQAWRKLWLADHPGRTSKEYTQVQNSEDVWAWRRAKGQAAIAAERAAFAEDHGGRELPEHLCGLTETEATEYDDWRKRYLARWKT